MIDIELPYDKKTITAHIADENFAGKLVSKAANFKAKFDEKELVERSLDEAIGGPTLEEQAQGKKIL